MTNLSPSVKYLVSVLEQRIRNGQYPHGRWLPSERSLSEEFSVCRPTIRRAIIELEERKLLHRALGHRPVVWFESPHDSLPTGHVAGAPRSLHPPVAPEILKKRRSIGLWISGNPTDQGPMAMTSSIYRALSRFGEERRLVVTCPQGNSAKEFVRSEADILTRMVNDEDIAGMILWYLGGIENLPILQKLRAAQKPLIFVDRKPPSGFEADFVGTYNEYGALEAVRYLISLGHRRIAYITNPDRASSVQERLEGYKRALLEAGIPFRPDYVLNGPFSGVGKVSEDEQWHALLRTLKQFPGPVTAVFAVNDYNASRVIRYARFHEIRIPEDLSVVGFDNSERWGAVNAFMTSISQPFEEIGEEAVRLLIERLQNPVTATFRHLLLPAPLVVRTSTRPR